MVAASVATLLLITVGVLVTLRARPAEEHPAGQTPLDWLAAAAAAHPEAYETGTTRGRLHLTVSRAASSKCWVGSAAVTSSLLGLTPLPKPLQRSLLLTPWRPSDDELRELDCDGAMASMSTVEIAKFVVPADEAALLDALPAGLDLDELRDPRVLGKETPVESIDATPAAIQRAFGVDVDSQQWWGRWVEFVSGDLTRADQRRAAMRVAADRTDVTVVDGPTSDLAGRAGVTLRVPYPASDYADLTFDARTGVLLQYRVVATVGYGTQIDITTLDALPSASQARLGIVDVCRKARSRPCDGSGTLAHLTKDRETTRMPQFAALRRKPTIRYFPVDS